VPAARPQLGRVQSRSLPRPNQPRRIRTESHPIPLLDVHLNLDYARRVHRYALDHVSELIDQPLEVIPTEDWLSINCIGFPHERMKYLARTVGTVSPAVIAGRPMGPARIGDEGVVNTAERCVIQGFTCTHLSFGVQHQQQHEREWDRLRRQWALVGEQYLSRTGEVYGDNPCIEQSLSPVPLPASS
jgi:hypothetical protein